MITENLSADRFFLVKKNPAQHP